MKNEWEMSGKSKPINEIENGNDMKMPKYSGLIRVIAEVVARLGCLIGAIMIFVSFKAFDYGFMAGITAISSGIITIISSLAVLGFTYCFLAIVKAQIDSRNAIVNYIASKDKDET